ncbi:hypothetical protein ACOSQ3_030973 [Xanthoceras sorbifolium]
MVTTDDSSASNNIEYYSNSNISAAIIVMEDAFLVMKGKAVEYNAILNLVRSIDLSRNNFSGKIPIEITNLRALMFLNLSHNSFTGRIPRSIGAMRSLEQLDFSENQLSGEIPQSISDLSLLSDLRLTNNKLIGRIPSGTQFQSFDASWFAGNQLCGSPLPKKCTETVLPPDDESEEGDDGNEKEVDWFYVSMALGFVVGLWSVIGPLIVNRRWRYMYSHFLDRLGDKFVISVVCKCC